MNNIIIFNEEGNMRRAIAEHLLQTEAIRIRPEKPFETAKGQKTPIECDIRTLFSYNEPKAYVMDKMLKHIYEKEFGDKDIDNVAGIAHGGTQWATLLADKIGIGMVEVFSSQREVHQQRNIEGRLQGKKRTIIIEDFLNDGKGTLEAIETLTSLGADITGMIIIYSHQLPTAMKRLSGLPLPIHIMCDYDTLINVAQKDNRLRLGDEEELRWWRKDPENWSLSRGGRNKP